MIDDSLANPLDTIVACASPWGTAGVSLIRLSGPFALVIAKKIARREAFLPRKQHYCRIYDDSALVDQVLLSYMPNPHSFTGEDVVEISCHGNPVIVELIIDLCVRLGARPARNGEFSRRAVENQKLSLLQAEALQGLVHARSAEGVYWAHQGLDGVMDQDVGTLKDKLLDFCAEMEARLDYPQEGLEYIDDQILAEKILEIKEDCIQSANTWKAGRIRLHGAQVAILGPVNAGKSSLFNHLVGKNRAIVSEQPGTTRDVVEKSILINGMDVCFFDTAGVREYTEDVIEEQGMLLGMETAREVDLCLLLFPLHLSNTTIIDRIQKQLPHKEMLLIGTHVDLSHSPTSIPVDCTISNINGEGIDKLRFLIRDRLGKIPLFGSRWVILSQRQHELFLCIGRHLQSAVAALLGDFGPAIAAEEIIQALERIGELSGEDVRESVLDRLFSRFCIGK